MLNLSLSTLCFWSCLDRMQARKSGLGRSLLNIGSVIYHYNHKPWEKIRKKKGGGRMGVVLLGRSPYLHRSDWWGWRIGPVMVQLHTVRQDVFEGHSWRVRTMRMKWFMLKGKVAKQMMLPSWPCRSDKISSLLLILNDSLTWRLFHSADFFIDGHVCSFWKGLSWKA